MTGTICERIFITGRQKHSARERTSYMSEIVEDKGYDRIKAYLK